MIHAVRLVAVWRCLYERYIPTCATFRNIYSTIFIGIVGVLCVNYASASTLSCISNSSSAVFSVPTKSYTVPRDASVGTLIGAFTPWQSAGSNVWTCSDTTNAFVGPVYKSVLSASSDAGYPITYFDGSTTYQVFDTNVRGVGLVMKISSSTPSGWYAGNYGMGTSDWNVAGTYNSPSGFSNAAFGLRMEFAFVKTGDITPGVFQSGILVANAGVAERPFAQVTNTIPIYLSGSPSFNEAACTTPNSISVDLGSHLSSEFRGLNSVTSSVAFSIALNNCPIGMNEVDYEIDAATQIIDSSNSVVALDSSSSAGGIGVQLLDGSGNPIPFGTPLTFNDYNAGTGGSYTIPLKARYYQTGTLVTPGHANTVMTFTMSYL